MADFTPWSSLAGGVLIGVAATLLLVANGRIAGISGIVGGLLRAQHGETAWRALFVAGLLAGGLVLQSIRPTVIGPSVVGFPSCWSGGAAGRLRDGARQRLHERSRRVRHRPPVAALAGRDRDVHARRRRDDVFVRHLLGAGA